MWHTAGDLTRPHESAAPHQLVASLREHRRTASPRMTMTAEGALVEFVRAAEAADARTAAVVLATDPSPVAASIPAGMPPRLLLPVPTR